ncbi:DUF2274 domain-containing protein [Dongia sedimenti]|uniref:DUF2274 domain-containing protein n=1 Tax=Dongia sedimenti TaxID=3064282 RepID=A0ABU0YVA1_9PROT|nr:DUF2274 domain-containing protein [Rhodospirillaceae bacterium R-7]
MPDLKLSKLPDRVPVKMTFTARPDLAQGLREYAAVYRATYGEAESVEELIPFMLASFLEGDRGFAKARKEVTELPATEPRPRRGRRKKTSSQQPDGLSEEA